MIEAKKIYRNFDERNTLVEQVDEDKDTLFSKISFWTSIILSVGVCLWYYVANPPDEGANKEMRLFIAKNGKNVTEFLRMAREDKTNYAKKNRHPFYKNYIEASEVTKQESKGIVHTSLDYKSNQYWFYLGFFGLISFFGFWFIGQMTEAIVQIVQEEKKMK